MKHSIRFNSSAIPKAEYDDESRRLDLWFKNGRSSPYWFANVPYSIWQGLLGATSKGGYYQNYIRGRYRAF